MEQSKKIREHTFHITKNQNVSLKKKWCIRGGAFAFAILIMIIFSLVSSNCGIGMFFSKMFSANFGSKYSIFDMLNSTCILLLIALALTPAFKMKFWNIGAEGQVIIGTLICYITQLFIGTKMNLTNPFIRIIFFLLAIIFSIIGGAIWGLIPAIFKAKFNTNETLFTLMMNYVALLLVKILINVWDPVHGGGGITKFNDNFYFPSLGSQFTINIILVLIITVVVFIYLRFTKHGYELSVVGESRNTAQYVGININKIILRTMILSGAICGLCGALMILGNKTAISADLVSGKGFTGVMIAWISGFNPFEMLLFSFLSAFITKGGKMINQNAYFPGVLVALTFFVIVASEFFVNYTIHSEKLDKIYAWFSNAFKIKTTKAEVINMDKVNSEKSLLENDLTKKKSKLSSLFKKDDTDQIIQSTLTENTAKIYKKEFKKHKKEAENKLNSKKTIKNKSNKKEGK